VFYVDFYSHDVELDSGEYFAGIRLWNESVQVIDPETSPRPTRHISSIKDCKQNFIAADLLKRRFRGKKEARESTLNAKRKAIEIQHDALSNVQRCESCSRSHKSIAYCVSRGHSTGLAGIDADVRNETVRGVDAKTEFVPRTAARRGGNGKFVVSESVGTALATAGVEIPERCALCIRRKKGLAHCLKKGHVAGTETAAAIILPATELLKTRSTFAPRASAAGSAPLALDSDRPTDTTSHDPNLFVCRLSKTVRVARDDSAQTQAVAAAAQRKAEFGYSTVDFRPFINAVTSPHTSPELTAANSSHRLHVVSTLETLPSGNIYLMIVRMYVRSIYISHFADGFTCKTASDDKTNIPLPLY
jgi:hypothetical protein